MIYENSPSIRNGLVATLSAMAILGTQNNHEKVNEEALKDDKHHTIEQYKYIGKTIIANLSYDFSNTATTAKKHKVKMHYHTELPPILKRIGGCETRNSPTAKINYRARNPNSSATGGFQITYDTWDHFKGYNEAIDAPPYIQNQKALILYHSRGTNPWVSSEYCWG